jgi:hypothetical protein
MSSAYVKRPPLFRALKKSRTRQGYGVETVDAPRRFVRVAVFNLGKECQVSLTLRAAKEMKKDLTLAINAAEAERGDVEVKL